MKSGQCVVWAEALVLLFSEVNSFAQGTVFFSNSESSMVANGLTGEPLDPGTKFLVALYYAPDGVTDESVFRQAGEAGGLFTPGRFALGDRSIPGIPCGSYAMLQVRAWETAFGSTYDEAVSAPPQDGRFALAGRSNLFRRNLGGCPPGGVPGLVPGLEGFALHPVPEPRSTILILVGFLLLPFVKQRALRACFPSLAQVRQP